MTATWLREYACALRSTVWIETWLLKRRHFPVSFCVILLNTLHSCHLHQKSLSSWRDCLSRVDAESWIIDESSTINFREENSRDLCFIKCLARRSTRHSVKFDSWRSTTIQLTAAVEIFECTSFREIQRMNWTTREQRRGKKNQWELSNSWELRVIKRELTKL